jgi:hypothetical protein
VTEYAHKICPRCGEPADDYRFCQACRAHIDSLTGGAQSEAQASEPADASAHLLREVERLEQALAAASQGLGDRSVAPPSSTAVEVETEPRPAEDVTADASATQAPVANDQVSVAPPSTREVARLEDVLKVAPTRSTEVAPSEVEASAPEAPVNDLPQAFIEAPPKEDETEEPVEATDAEPAEESAPATSTEERASEPVPAHLLREAVWFELASMVEATTPEAPQAAAPEVDIERTVNSIPPPVVSAQPSAEPAPPVHTEQSRWLAALCLLLLIGLVVALTGRRPRNFTETR